ncbi:erythropoietin receptor [Discoglossus pictus]
MGVRLYGTPNWGSIILLLVLWDGLSRGAKEKTPLTPELLRRVSEVIEEPENLFCFTMHLEDYACFWESAKENVTYKFTYHEQSEDTVKYCKVDTLMASNDTWWHVCDFPATDVVMFSSVDISVIDEENHNATVYHRSVSMDQMVFLEPPINLTVEEKWKPWGLLVSWVLTDEPFGVSIKYQINYTTTETGKHMVEESEKSEILLTKLRADTQYAIKVRARACDVTWNGYWSEWSEPVTIWTNNGWDLLHMMLFFVVSLLCVIVILFLVLRKRRFLKQKVWPQVPTPEGLFQGLFTTHKGNFKLWLGQADLYLVWVSRHFFHEDSSSSLEVLSELIPAPALSISPAQLPPKDGYVSLDENLVPHFPAWTEPLTEEARGKIQTHEPRWMEAPGRDTRQEEAAWVGTPRTETSLEEILTDDNDWERSESIQQKVSREDSVSSDEGLQSLTSSYEYTVVETCEGLLAPKPRPILPEHSMKYGYFLMSDIKKQNVPPPPNHYENSICTSLPNPVYSQC